MVRPTQELLIIDFLFFSKWSKWGGLPVCIFHTSCSLQSKSCLFNDPNQDNTYQGIFLYMSPVSLVFHTIVSWDWSKKMYLEQNSRSIIMSIHTFVISFWYFIHSASWIELIIFLSTFLSFYLLYVVNLTLWTVLFK